MNRVRIAFLFVLACATSGCMTVDSRLVVSPADGAGALTFNDRGTLVDIPAGAYSVQLDLAEHSKDESEISFPSLHRKFKLHLPDAKRFLNVNSPFEISSDDLGQPFSMAISRVTDLKKDHYSITLINPDTRAQLATGEFDYKSSTVAYDDETGSFLQSFQNVRHSQRGTVIPVMSRVSPIIDHIGQVYISPWIYARYTHVEWVFGEYRYGAHVREKWKKVIDASPVVDVFLLNHEGDDINELEESSDLGWKKHQLRLVYTEGCDSASSTYFLRFMSKFNAAIAIGHRATSASPFVAFPLIRFWTYGSSALAATRMGWGFGSFEGGLIDYLSFTALSHSLWRGHGHMLESTEPGLGWTTELTPDKVFIDQSALVSRDTDENRTWYVSFIRKFGKEVSSGPLDMSDSLFRVTAQQSTQAPDPFVVP